jgi:16S rRNA U516 pseudouridylate synthase RsuA-like enzyme
VRHMTAAVGFPTLRLVRAQIGKFDIGQMLPGDLVQVERGELMKKLGLK